MNDSGHFLRICDFPVKRLEAIIRRGIELKQARDTGDIGQFLTGKVMTMLFTKPSTRTRVSFEAGMALLGGSTIYLDPTTMQMSRGESIEDTARVLSSMSDAIVVRTQDHKTVETLAAHSSSPVINALTDVEHPCQVLADLMTLLEVCGKVEGLKVAWIGDCNNVCKSWMAAAKPFGFSLAVASPASYSFAKDEQATMEGVSFTEDPKEAVQDANCVVTDVWYSMGDEKNRQTRIDAFSGYTVDEGLMSLAEKDAVFMHCLPAHRGEEVTAEVIDGKQSVVWIEAENRMHAQMALLLDMLR